MPSEKKYCSNCRWIRVDMKIDYLPSRLIDARCMHQSARDKGRSGYEFVAPELDKAPFCRNMRISDDACGRDGKWWEK